MTIDELVARFEQRSSSLIKQAHVFLVGVLILLFAGALAVIYAQNITAGDIGGPTSDEKLAAIHKEEDKIDARLKEIHDGPAKQCTTALQQALSKWTASVPGRLGIPIGGSSSQTMATGDLIAEQVQQYLSDHPDVKGAVLFVVGPVNSFCPSAPIFFSVETSGLSEFKSALSGKTFFSEETASALSKEVKSQGSRRDSLETIGSQTNLEKLEVEVGIMKQPNPTAKSENDLFLRLVQTSVTRFGLLAVIGFFVSILVSLYRYNVRLAAFYTARADALRLLEPPSAVSDFALIVTALSPTVEFGKGPQPPIAQLVDLVKAAKDSAK
jgi:hypothetical protein